MSIYKGNLTADHIQGQYGTDALNELCAMICEPTNRVMDNGKVEFSASIVREQDTITVYYYQEAKDVKDCENLDELDWYAHGFTIS